MKDVANVFRRQDCPSSIECAANKCAGAVGMVLDHDMLDDDMVFVDRPDLRCIYKYMYTGKFVTQKEYDRYQLQAKLINDLRARRDSKGQVR